MTNELPSKSSFPNKSKYNSTSEIYNSEDRFMKCLANFSESSDPYRTNNGNVEYNGESMFANARKAVSTDVLDIIFYLEHRFHLLVFRRAGA